MRNLFRRSDRGKGRYAVYCFSGIARLAAAVVTVAAPSVFALDFTIEQIADPAVVNRDPVIGDGIVAWHGFRLDEDKTYGNDIFIYRSGQRENLSLGRAEDRSANIHPVVKGKRIAWTSTTTNPVTPGEVTWEMIDVPLSGDPDAPGKDLSGNMVLTDPVAHTFVPVSEILTNAADGLIAGGLIKGTTRFGSGNNEILYWDAEGDMKRLTKDTRNDIACDFDGDLFAWQKAKGWPFGWEIMVYNDGNRYQLTTNFYYDMSPRVHKDKVTYYGWDGNDFEVYLHDATEGGIIQVTSNDYDDVSPFIHDGKIAWMGYKRVEADIYYYDGTDIKVISNNPEGDDINPVVWNGQVAWQGFDGDDFEIYLYNGTVTVKITENFYDDVNPSFSDNLIAWMGYEDNWDPEIFTWLTDEQIMIQVTTNELEDRSPQTINRRIVWQTDDPEGSHVYLATPK